MDDPLAFAGTWWVNKDQSQEGTGNLSSDQEGVHLRLLLRLVSLDGLDELSSVECIHGVTNSGEYVLLVNCYEVTRSWNSNSGILSREFSASHALVSGHDLSAVGPELAIVEARILWPDLALWLHKPGFEIETIDEGAEAGFEIRYRNRAPRTVRLAEGLELTFKPRLSKIPRRWPAMTKIELSETLQIGIQSSEALSLTRVLQIIERLKQTFSICLGDYTTPSSIHLVLELNDLNVSEEVLRVPAKLHSRRLDLSNRSTEPRNSRYFLISAQDIEHDFEGIVRGWYCGMEDTAPASDLYFAAVYGNIQYADHAFLSLMQAAEVLHRTRYPGTLLPTSVFEEQVLPALKSALPSDIERDARTALKARMVYWNELSMRQRLKALTKKHHAALAHYFKDPVDLASATVDLRNAIVHSGSAGTSGGVELVRSRDFVRLLLELELLSISELSLEVLHKKAATSQTYFHRYGVWRIDATR